LGAWAGRTSELSFFLHFPTKPPAQARRKTLQLSLQNELEESFVQIYNYFPAGIFI
jgi:hypothetical protein